MNKTFEKFQDGKPGAREAGLQISARWSEKVDALEKFMLLISLP